MERGNNVEKINKQEKERLEMAKSQEWNEARVAEMQQEAQKETVEASAADEVITKEEADHIASVFFEDDAEVTLRDGKKYKIIPVSLKDARFLMGSLGSFHMEGIALNFIKEATPADNKRNAEMQECLMAVLMLAFKPYPEVTRDYIETYVDVRLASKIINLMMDLNDLKNE